MTVAVGLPAPEPLTRFPIVERLTSDIDGYRAGAAGVELDMVRGGRDQQPSRMRTVPSDLGIAVSVAEPGCKTISHTQMAGDWMAATYVADVAPGTKWCGDLEIAAGASTIHQPDAEHTAVNVPGTKFAFTIAEVDAVAERAAVLEVPLMPWCRGEVDVVYGHKGGFASNLAHIANDPVDSVPRRLMDDLLTTIALSLYHPDWDRRLPATTAVDSRKVVGDCIEFAATIGREPSISEMCLVAHVGGRRLRQAFHDTCDVSPRRFFRHWILCQAHDRLLAAASGSTSVTRIATDLGLSHLGRFSVQYRELHGECPSETLDRSPAVNSA
jgi:AraC-like DNA-binding protein